MKLKRFKNFYLIKENFKLNFPISIETEFAYDEFLDDYDGDTEEEQFINMIYDFSEDIYKISKPKVEVKSMEYGSGGWPLVVITFKNLEECEKALNFMWGEDDWMVCTSIANSLISDNKERDAFNYLKYKGEKEYFDDVKFSEDFMKNLPDEDKNYLSSIKGIDKYNM